MQTELLHLRSGFIAAVMLCSTFCSVFTAEAADGAEEPKAEATAAEGGADISADEISRQVSRLEAELNGFSDTAPEAADIMVQLADLYHQHGRLFGLIRIGQRFASSHTADPRHREVMLKLIDGLQAATRNKDLVIACRQFLTRYPSAEECAQVERRLAETLGQMNDPAATAAAWQAVWDRGRNQDVRAAGVEAMRLYISVNNAAVYQKGAEVARDMLEKLPPGQFTSIVGMHAVAQWRRAGQWARSNQAALLMLEKNLPADKSSQRDVHTMMAENYANLGQYANSVESYRKARQLEEGPSHHFQMIVRMYQANLPTAELEAEVNAYLQRYPERPDRFQTQSYLAQAYLRAGNNPRALQLLAALLPHDSITNSNASVYARVNGTEPAQLAETEKVLRQAIAQNPRPADVTYLRYVLALELLRDRVKDFTKAQQVCRDQITQSPDNSNYTWYCVSWLLSSVESDSQFQSDVALILKSRQQHAHLTGFQDDLTQWARDVRRNKDLQARAEFVTNAVKAANQNPVVALWVNGETTNSRDRGGEQAREKLLSPQIFNSIPDDQALAVLQLQATYYWSYAGGDKRARAAGVYSQWIKRFPEDYNAAKTYVHFTSDYSPAELKRDALVHLLKFEPQESNSDLWRRVMLNADATGEAELVKRAYDWILQSEKLHGTQSTYGYYIGDLLLKHKFETEAVERWQTYLKADYTSADSRECASRLLARIEQPAAKLSFLKELYARDTDFLGRYAEWIAAIHLEAGDLDAFEKILRDARSRQDERPLHSWELYEYTAQAWVDQWRADQEMETATKIRLFSLIEELDIFRTSSMARLARLELIPENEIPPLERMIAVQRATLGVGDGSHDWDRLMPYVQNALTSNRYIDAAVLLTGMLGNISAPDAGRLSSGRELVAQAYARMGSVGLTIDEDSPIAPLLQAALYLRLGDERLAFDTYVANRALFDEHRDEVPVDLLQFVAGNLIAAGGDANHEQAEEILRGWIVKNSEAKHIEPATKASVQLLLARNFFKSQRFDLARTEFTTVINRYPETSEAVEAQFGIGETFMSQKVYDQAERVFEKLASSRDTEVIVRAEFLRGVLAHRRGDRDEARDIFRSVLERVPNIELANQALFNLAEVYGDEERYIDQLNLLRTVGRLGRASKRRHKPGTPLSIVVQDSDLGISRGHNRIPVTVRTSPGGDQETIYLTSGGAGKGLFRADLETRLGEVTQGDKVLQLSGRDSIQCDYPEEFKNEFRHVALSDVEISIAADAEFQMSSSRILDQDDESFSEELARESDRGEEDQRVSVGRPVNQVKPGNQVYLRVEDADRDLTNEADRIILRLDASSGDQVQVSLTETGPHTGVFEGTVATGELPAGALASDTSIEHSPLMAIDQDPNSYWMSEPDGATPKQLTIDMKDLRRVSRIRLTSPQADQHVPVRGTLMGSNDGRFWFRLASHPIEPPAAPVSVETGRMTMRIYDGNYTRYTNWDQIVSLGRNGKPIEEREVDELLWKRDADSDDANEPHAAIWTGKFVQERDGAARFQVQGDRTALVIDGRLELPPAGGTRTVDVWLPRGLHDLTVFSATSAATRPMSALLARADHNSPRVQLLPFQKSDFDLEQPAAIGLADEQPVPADNSRVSVADRSWEFQVEPIELRFVRLVVHEYLGEAVAISNVEISGELADELYIPTKEDVLGLSRNSVLEIAGGDTVTGTYADEFTQSDSGTSRLLTSELVATYFDASIAAVSYDFVRRSNGIVEPRRKLLMRVDPGERIVVEIIDYDQDQTDQRDEIPLQVFVNDEEPLLLTATETEEYSGIFTKEVDTSATAEEGKLQVKAGDRIYFRYIDSQNTFPGHAVPREGVVHVAQPSEGRIRIYETRVIPPPEGSTAPPQHIVRKPAEDLETTGVAFEAPFTVEVIDPDRARDSASSVVVKLQTTDGATIDVRCVISGQFQQYRGVGDALTARALREGRFIGQAILQLGGKASPVEVPLSADMPRNLIGGPVFEEDEDGGEAAIDRLLVTRVLNLTGSDLIDVTYADESRPGNSPASLKATGRLISNGQLLCVDRDYEKPVTQLHVGEKLFLMVIDADQDTSGQRDRTRVEITSDRGEKETVELEETLAHSGVFTGSLTLRPKEAPVAGNLDAEDPVLETYFGDLIEIRYIDSAASTESGKLELSQKIPVVIGTDGLVAAFSKTFNDEHLAVETKFHIAESYFELFKSHRKLARSNEERTDLEAGRRVLREVIEDYPDPKYVPRIAYLLGQFSQELGQWREAIESYDMIVRQHPDHSLAPDAQYKLAQCQEEAGKFDQALEEYVTLAATYPRSPLIANVMIRICDHFYKSERFDVAAQVGRKFLERFDTHQYASRMAFRVGQCYFKGKKFNEAGQAFDLFAQEFPEDTLCADALFWSGESYRMSRNNREAFRRYNNCRWKFPASDAAKYARGRLALPEMLQQFEAEANSVDDNN